MTKKPTKEELLVQLELLKSNNQAWAQADERRRKEFAKAFSWFKKRGQYDYNSEPEPSLPTWEQIWVNLGSLLASRNFLDFSGNVRDLQTKVEALENKYREEID